MSRKGNQPISIPSGVEVKIADGMISVKGPKGSLQQELRDDLVVAVDGDTIKVTVPEGHKGRTNFQGLIHALITNMVVGVTQGWKKELEMIGVGYRAAVKGNVLDVQVGKSHPVEVPIPEGITVEVVKGTAIAVNGSDKRIVGQFAADVRAQRPPEPYKGKGIRYKDEYVRRKAGKAAGK